MDNCIFCMIERNEIPSNKVYEDEKILAFHDIKPAAPVHVVIIPKCEGKTHFARINDITSENADVVSHIMLKVPKIASDLGLSGGYRVITNNGADAGQTVAHLHFHLLGGKPMLEL